MPFPSNPAGACEATTTVVPPTPVYCASLNMPGGGYLFHPADSRDPAATVAVTDCATPPTIIGYAYPAAGPGHTVAVEGCGGGVVGYIPNRSECAPCADSSSTVTIQQPAPLIVTGTGDALVTTTAAGYNVHVDAAASQPVVVTGSNGNVVTATPTGYNVAAPTAPTVTGTGAAIVTNTATGYNVNVPAIPVEINVQGLSLDAAGDLILTETDGSTHQVNIPASPDAVVTINGSAANVTQTGAGGHTIDLTIPPNPVVTGSGVAVVTTTATGFNVNVPTPPAEINVQSLALTPTNELRLTETDGTVHAVQLPTAGGGTGCDAFAAGKLYDIAVQDVDGLDTNITHLDISAAFPPGPLPTSTTYMPLPAGTFPQLNRSLTITAPADTCYKYRVMFDIALGSLTITQTKGSLLGIERRFALGASFPDSSIDQHQWHASELVAGGNQDYSRGGGAATGFAHADILTAGQSLTLQMTAQLFNQAYFPNPSYYNLTVRPPKIRMWLQRIPA